GVANTLVVAASSAVIATLLGLGIALCSARSRRGIARLLDRASLGSVAIPPLLVAFGAMITFLSVPVGIYGTIGMLVIAYSYRIALSTRMARAGLAQVPPHLQEAAEACGARWVRTQASVTVPLIAPGICASVAFLFVVGMK